MPRPTGSCVFCGRVGNLSKQHVMPDRLKKILPREPGGGLRLYIATERNPAGAITSLNVHTKKEHGHPGTRKIRRVCIGCNTGWMKASEEDAFISATPLIFGELRALDGTDQRRLAMLATTIDAVADLGNPATRAIPPADLRRIKDDLSPPPNWHIFAGRADAHSWRTRWRHHGARLTAIGDVSGSKECNVHWTTIVMGRLLLQVVAYHVEGNGLNPDVYASMLGLAPIFPSLGPVDLARLPAHGDDAVLQVADALSTFLADGERFAEVRPRGHNALPLSSGTATQFKNATPGTP